MKTKLKRLKKQIERAGGRMMISKDMPDDLAEFFAKVIADCPDCAAAMASAPKRNGSRHEH